ncbi:hypothetical protein DR864_14945 [Runella rosea]|uniref:AAA+ ATPase domain-containing protein n=1 Tax=Runella rosea TaxID=2259595 RepID=A0A344TJY3_9BACT|nr:AAA family ATPase [Runella rosea]AXE18954.1 hypothetical protein DR864_14945 [Runella rosea]
MDKQKLPLQLLRYLKEIEERIKSSQIELEVISNETYFLLIRSRKYSDFFFNLSWKNQNNSITLSAEVYPASPTGDVSRFNFEGSAIPHIDNWLSYVKEYDDIDIGSLFPIENSLQPEEDIFEEKDKILPYCLQRLSVENFQGIKHATIENLPVDTQWVFLVGENGFGKSTVLQSILLGLHGSKDGSYEVVQNQYIRIRVQYKSDKENFFNDCWRNPHPLTHLAAYGPSRLNLQADATLSDEARKSSVTYSLFNSDGALLNIEAKLKDWLLQKDKKRFELVKKAFLKLIPYLSDMRLNESTSQIEYLEKDIIDGTETYEPLPYQKLASGFRAIIGLAGDMIVRLSNAQPTIKDPAQLKGIVLIDELDLHWHPKLQKQIPQLFSGVFPKVQFIVSTHSPIPLLGAPHNSVVLKVTRTKEEGVKIERVDIDLKYLTPNLILTSGIFDMDDVLSVENDDLTKTRTEDTFEEMKHNDEVEDYLAEFEKSNRQFPDELFEPKAN